MLTRLFLGSLCNFLQKRKSSRRKKSSKIFRCTDVVCNSTLYICFRIFVIVISIHGAHYLIHHVRTNVLHIRKIGHMIDPVLFLVLQNFLT